MGRAGAEVDPRLEAPTDPRRDARRARDVHPRVSDVACPDVRIDGDKRDSCHRRATPVSSRLAGLDGQLGPPDVLLQDHFAWHKLNPIRGC